MEGALGPLSRALTIITLVALGAMASGAARAETVRIGWLRGTNDVTLGKARGTIERSLAAQGVTVAWVGPFPASAPAVEALNGGAIDVTIGSSTSAVTSLAAGAPVVVFAYQRMGPQAESLLVKAESGIRSVKDLVGKSVAVNRGGTGEYLLVRALETHGVDPASVKRVYLGPADAGSSFAQGHVDAWATWDPFLTIALDAYGARVLADGPAIGSENAIVLLAHRDFAKSKRALLEAVFDAVAADNAWSVANREAAGAIWAGELKVPAAYGPALGANNAVPTIAVGAPQAAEIGRIADWYAANGIVPKRPDVADAVIDLSR